MTKSIVLKIKGELNDERIKGSIMKEYWIYYDGMHGSIESPLAVLSQKPVQLSGGGNNIDVHVIEYAAYKESQDKIKELESQIRMLNMKMMNEHSESLKLKGNL
jgi:hypothetical protein